MPDTPSVPDESSRLAQLTWLIALPATVSAALLAATAGYLANGDHTVLLALLAAAIVIVLAVAVYAVGKVRRGGERSAELRAMAVESRSGLAESRSELVETRSQLGETRNELAGARAEIERLTARVRQAEAAPPPMPPPGHPTGRQVEVFVNLSRRLQSLVHREIKLLDALENEVEDPDLLKGLFQVDHLATRIRRHAENLAVLGGSVSRRQWSRPVALTEVLRSAIAEVEHYSRVKLVPPIDGTLPGHAVASVVHLIAELIENATMFAPPQTQVLLRSQRVAAGLAIEVEDRGLGMQRGDQERINQLLVNPDHINLDDLLRDGRIGLYVVSVIARQHGIVVQLQTNIYGGTQAIVILPQPLLDSPTTGEPRAPAAARPESLSELTTEIPQQTAWPVSPPPRQLPGAPVPGAPAVGAPALGAPAVAAPVPGAPVLGVPDFAGSDRAAPDRGASDRGASDRGASAPTAPPAVPSPASLSPAAPSPVAFHGDRYATSPPVSHQVPVGPTAGFSDLPSAGFSGRPSNGFPADGFASRSAGLFGSPASSPGGSPVGSPDGSPASSPGGRPVGSPSVGLSGDPSAGPFASPSVGLSGGPSAGSSGNPPGNPPGNPSGNPAGNPSGGPGRSSGLPPLPRRRSQTHMVPQLQLGPPAPAPEPTGEHNPGLMASFMHGVSQGEADPAGQDSL